MSRGPGRIEQSIRQLFDANPDEAFVTDELCEHCYPGVRPIEKKHQVAVLRAAWNVLKADPNWTAKRECGDQGNRWKFYNRDSGESRIRKLRPKSKQPVQHEWEWVNYGPGFGRARRKVPKAEIQDRAESDTLARKKRDRTFVGVPIRHDMSRVSRYPCPVSLRNCVMLAKPYRRRRGPPSAHLL